MIYLLLRSPITEDQQLHCPSPEISESRCDWLLDDTESSLRNEAVYYIQVTVKTLIGSNSSKMIRLIPADIGMIGSLFIIGLYMFFCKYLWLTKLLKRLLV